MTFLITRILLKIFKLCQQTTRFQLPTCADCSNNAICEARRPTRPNGASHTTEAVLQKSRGRLSNLVQIKPPTIS